MDCPPKKVAVVERWLLVEVQSLSIFFNFFHPSFLFFFLFAPYFMPLFHVLSSLNLLMLLSWLVFIMIIFVTRLL